MWHQRKRLAGFSILTAALLAGTGIGAASAAVPPAQHVPATRHAAGSAPARGTVSAANQSLQAPLIDDVAPVADGTVQVTVTPGDTAQEMISKLDVYAYALDANGNPTGAPVATAEVTNPSPLNPPDVTVSGLTDNTEY